MKDLKAQMMKLSLDAHKQQQRRAVDENLLDIAGHCRHEMHNVKPAASSSLPSPERLALETEILETDRQTRAEEAELEDHILKVHVHVPAKKSST